MDGHTDGWLDGHTDGRTDKPSCRGRISKEEKKKKKKKKKKKEKKKTRISCCCCPKAKEVDIVYQYLVPIFDKKAGIYTEMYIFSAELTLIGFVEDGEGCFGGLVLNMVRRFRAANHCIILCV